MSSIPLARSSDPLESHLAAEAVLAEGIVARMSAITLDLVREHPGCTANELEAISGEQIHKRLREMERRGLVERGESRASRITGKLNATWYVATGKTEKELQREFGF